MKKRSAGQFSGSLARKLREKRAQRNLSRQQLFELAETPVPEGSGYQVHGRGRFIYCKANRLDGSTRELRFETLADMEEAMARGVAADEPIGEAASA